MNFGKITKLNLREIWPREAADFTPWLAENISALGEAIGMELELKQIEATVGDFSLDLLARDLGTGHTVVIENQLTHTDHDHLGKLLTYAAGFGATSVVWIAKHIRDEHSQALEWLNQRTDEETLFFGVAIEVIKIDNSNPAFVFKTVVAPSEWQKTKKRQASANVNTKSELYRNYFQQLTDELREVHGYTNARIGQPQNWYSFPSGTTGLTFNASFAQGNKARTELYIDFGDMVKNKAFFKWLEERKVDIHTKLGYELTWEALEDKRASRISIYRVGSVDSDKEELALIKSWHVENLIKMKLVFAPYITQGLQEIN